MGYQMQVAMNAAQREQLRLQKAEMDQRQKMQLLEGFVMRPAQAVLGRALEQWETPGQAAQTKSQLLDNEKQQMALDEAKRNEAFMDQAIPQKYYDPATGAILDEQGAGEQGMTPQAAQVQRPGPGTQAVAAVGSMLGNAAGKVRGNQAISTAPIPYPAPQSGVESELRIPAKYTKDYGQANAMPAPGSVPGYTSPVRKFQAPEPQPVAGKGMVAEMARNRGAKLVTEGARAQAAGVKKLEPLTPRKAMYATKANEFMAAYEAPARAGYAATVAAIEKQDKDARDAWEKIELKRVDLVKAQMRADAQRDAAGIGAAIAAKKEYVLAGLTALKDDLNAHVKVATGGTTIDKLTDFEKQQFIKDPIVVEKVKKMRDQYKEKTGIDIGVTPESALGMPAKEMQQAATSAAQETAAGAQAQSAEQDAERKRQENEFHSQGKLAPWEKAPGSAKPAPTLSDFGAKGDAEAKRDFGNVFVQYTVGSGGNWSLGDAAQRAKFDAEMNRRSVEMEAEYRAAKDAGDEGTARRIMDKARAIGRLKEKAIANPSSMMAEIAPYLTLGK